ncbi:MAG: hypothetical protein ACR2QE_20740 [Acidimicrobiales bacterium]
MALMVMGCGSDAAPQPEAAASTSSTSTSSPPSLPPTSEPQASAPPTTTPSTTSEPQPEVAAGDAAAALCAVSGTDEVGRVENDDLREASGLVASRAHSGVFWSHNDSGNDGGVFAVGEDGSDLGFFALGDSVAFDVEDIALAPRTDGDHLLLADFGDNFEQRDTIAIYRFAEPVPGTPVVIDDFETLEFRYPDRPHNAEALLFDETSGRIVIVTKEQVAEDDPPDGSGPTAPSFVFEGVLDGAGDGPVELVPAGTIDTPHLETLTNGLVPHPLSVLGFGGVPTGGDVSADGALVALRTYETAWVWPRQPDQTVAEAFTNEPCEADTALEIQGEAIAFAAGHLVTVGEGKNRPLHRTESG